MGGFLIINRPYRPDRPQVLNLSRNKIVDTYKLKQPILECLDLNCKSVE